MAKHRSTPQQQLLQDFAELVTKRARQRESCLERYQSETSRIESEFDARQQAFEPGHLQQVEDSKREYQQQIEEEKAAFEFAMGNLRAEEQAELLEIQREYDAGIAAIDKKHGDASWLMDTVLGEDDDNPINTLEAFETQTRKTQQFFETDWSQAEEQYRGTEQTLRIRRLFVHDEGSASDPIGQIPMAECVDRFEQQIKEVSGLKRQIERNLLSRVLVSSRPLLLILTIGLPVALIAVGTRVGPMEFVESPDQADWPWLAVSSGIGFVAGCLVLCLIYLVCRVACGSRLERMRSCMHQARLLRSAWKDRAKRKLARLQREARQWQQETEARLAEARSRADAAATKQRDELMVRRTQQLDDVGERWPQRYEALKDEHDTRLHQFSQAHESQQQAYEQAAELQGSSSRQTRQRALDEAEAVRAEAWQSMTSNWQAGFRTWIDELHSLRTEAARNQPAWDRFVESGWSTPRETPDFIRIGEFRIDCGDFDELASDDPELQVGAEQFTVPAVLPFESDPSLLIETDRSGSESAVALMKGIMLRILTALPAGKIRFTVIDPVGLGEAFSGFMHLADFDELMIGSRIWTESAQIEKRLTDLTEHMENVFQTYLRDEFSTIQEYNRHACEVAEPFHVLVVAGFPHGFSESAARRLLSIASSGSRCGVFTVVGLDSRLKLPHAFDLEDLRAHSQRLIWKMDHFEWATEQGTLGSLIMEPLPPGDQLARIVRSVGESSQDARRVEVAFDRIAPRSNRVWKSDSRAGLEVPLGRAGATKLQFLKLGAGTSQHVLIAGKTGSGKSTFLHTLITNLALHYSPAEVEFYLVDFKKGVEFKTYVTESLPHARVVAIESDREFGLSVLERLDEVLRERGELFREAGVQDLPGYRDRNPEVSMPRILLIVDEFQEFFVEDDRVSHQSALLLDRLVRQGRAFGVHVLLGSQTLGGAYSLARSTLGQVAVRIALQCSETDAHLILSEENTAARLLTRPGEAIYNDANGRLEGNHTFQIAFLDELQRDRQLARIRGLAVQYQLHSQRPIVFEGQQAARLEDHPILQPDAAPVAASGSSHDVTLWLGDPVSIGPPMACPVTRRPGSHVLICGTNVAAAEGLMASLLLSWISHPVFSSATEQGLLSAGVTCLQATDSGTGKWSTWLSSVCPGVESVGPERLDECLDEWLAMIEERSNSTRNDQVPMLILVPGLTGFRELARSEEDYGLSGFGESRKQSVSQKFSRLLQQGPATGLHTAIWVDTCSNLNRWFSSKDQREFELRVALQMSPADSSRLIDTPAAGKLGPWRALFAQLGDGSLERFRPYGLPDPGWAGRFLTASSADPAPQVEEDIDSWTVF